MLQRRPHARSYEGLWGLFFLVLAVTRVLAKGGSVRGVNVLAIHVLNCGRPLTNSYRNSLVQWKGGLVEQSDHAWRTQPDQYTASATTLTLQDRSPMWVRRLTAHASRMRELPIHTVTVRPLRSGACKDMRQTEKSIMNNEHFLAAERGQR